MKQIITAIGLAGLVLSAANTAQAAPLIRDAAIFETAEIEGISLSTLPEDAFNALLAEGYQAGDITRYEDWHHGSIEFVRGSYSGPDGLSSISLGRSDGTLAFISQSLNKPGIDVGAEIGAMQAHFGIESDETDCQVNRSGTGGSCAVRNAEVPEDVTMKFTMTAQSMMILRSVSRPKAIIDTLE